MIWSKYFSLFLASMFKFMFAPLGGIALQLSFLETYLSCVSGAITAAFIFFFASEYFITKAIKKRQNNKENSVSQKKKFTFTNKLIIKIKKTFGIYGICFLAPFFLSVPIGTIISVKFYGKDKRTLPYIIVGILINGLISTSLVYWRIL